MTVQQMILAVRKRWWLIAAGILIAGGAAAALSLWWPRSYEAQALLLITKLRPSVTLDTRFQTVAEENVVNLSIQEEQVRRQTLIELAKSPEIGAQVVETLGSSLAAEERSLTRLSSMVKAKTTGNAIALTASAGDPAKAAAIANAWARVYADYVNKLYSTVSPNSEQIGVQLEGANKAYEQIEADLEAFLLSSQEHELTRQLEQKKQILADLQAGQLDSARQRVVALLDRANRIDGLLLDATNLRSQVMSTADGKPITAAEQFALFFLEAGTFVQTPAFSMTVEVGSGWSADGTLSSTQAAGRLDDIVATLEAARSTTLSEVERQSSAVLDGEELLGYWADAIADLQSQISRLEAAVQGEQWKKQKLLDAQTVARDTYLTLSRKAAEVKILTDVTSIEVQVAASATEPETPASPRPLLSIGLGVVAGALLGLALAFLAEVWSREARP
jgi:uncharacterized protein involved in exopolysaccharide biosynthesis